MSKLIATVFGVGYLKPGPGTWGSLISLPFFWLTYDIIGLIGSIIVGVILFFIGWKAIEVYSSKTQTHDASEVIIDEVVGQFIALLPIAVGAYATSTPIEHFWPSWISSFILFRVFDIFKPSVIGRVDKIESPLCVMLDDVFAGIFTACSVFLLMGVFYVIG